MTWGDVGSADGGKVEPLDRKVGFGKYAEHTWREVFEDDDGPSYVRWALKNVSRLSDELQEALTDELEHGGFGLD